LGKKAGQKRGNPSEYEWVVCRTNVWGKDLRARKKGGQLVRRPEKGGKKKKGGFGASQEGKKTSRTPETKAL